MPDMCLAIGIGQAATSTGLLDDFDILIPYIFLDVSLLDDCNLKYISLIVFTRELI